MLYGIFIGWLWGYGVMFVLLIIEAIYEDMAFKIEKTNNLKQLDKTIGLALFLSISSWFGVLILLSIWATRPGKQEADLKLQKQIKEHLAKNNGRLF